MNRSLAKLSFTLYDNYTSVPDKVKKGFKFCSATRDCTPNDWSVCLYLLEDCNPDNTVDVEVSFLMPAAEYLLQPGAKFKIFGGSLGKELTVEVIKTLEPLDHNRFGSP
jgi:hypothetical protein